MKSKLNIAKEERASGAVSGSVYAAYIRASNSWLPMVAFLFLQLVRLVSEMMMRLTQANWATLSFNFEDSKEYLGQYGIYLTTYIISYLGSALLLATILVNSARWDTVTLDIRLEKANSMYHTLNLISIPEISMIRCLGRFCSQK